jgi:hypothetical protein
VKKQESYALRAGMQNGTGAVENQMVFLEDFK